MFLSEEIQLLWFLSIVNYAHFSGTGHCRKPHDVQFNSCNENVKITSLLPYPLVLAEEPFYDPVTNSVYFVDVLASEVHRYCIKSGKHYFVQLGIKTVGFVIPIKGKRNKFLITYGDELCILTWDGTSECASFECFERPDPGHPFPAFFLNDAKAYPNGTRLFFYTVPFTLIDPIGSVRNRSSLFSLVRGKQKQLLAHFDFLNGLGWSHDGKRFYFSDSVRDSTYGAFYNEITNTLENIRLLVNYRKLGIPGFVDSLTVDRQGYVWVTINGGGALILKLDPESGRVKCAIKLPARGVTNLVFGRCPGAKNEWLDCIYVTTSSLTAKPALSLNDGGLFLIESSGSSGFTSDKLEPSAIFGKSKMNEYEKLLS